MGHDHDHEHLQDNDSNLNSGDAKWHKAEGVQVYTRRDAAGRPAKVDAIDEDRESIVRIADTLQKTGYGVMRQRSSRAGRIYHRLRAVWAGPGDPPENPFE